ncbi:hypothetical protein SBRY_80171 [Actinacidiphila bryophytorum]|uniref:Uncharacterized protein n=1 Tax=Actinacidiphila bryophytorum TaxID=1436133 RepID=A0A9W4H817_9ACTN|nr:hypothetical protein SBRY_80171 [Actinacidiphila bryophytorum]
MRTCVRCAYPEGRVHGDTALSRDMTWGTPQTNRRGTSGCCWSVRPRWQPWRRCWRS